MSTEGWIVIGVVVGLYIGLGVVDHHTKGPTINNRPSAWGRCPSRGALAAVVTDVSLVYLDANNNHGILFINSPKSKLSG